MIRKITTAAVLMLAFFMISPAAMSQDVIRCATMQVLEQTELKYPGTKARLEEIEKEVAKWVKDHPGDTRSTVTIPVVVHVVWHTNSQNISDEQIKSQIEVLNEDFNMQNADTANTPDPFKPVAGNCMIQFCLAAYDPDGDSTSGITRTYTTHTSFDTGDSLHFTELGGEDAWPSKDYLNVWTANLSDNVLGYGTLPGTAAPGQDGIVVLYKAFGRVGVLDPHYNLGRTATHEVGHWLGMKHTWGDDSGACSGSDGMADTPNQGDWTFNCPTFPVLDNCSPVYPGIMFMNFMDYTDDACMNLFTKDQAAYMNGELTQERASLLTSPAGCQGVQFLNDASTIKVLYPADTLDAESFQPQVQIANRGANILTSLQLYYQVDGQTPGVYNFSGSLATNLSELITLPLYFTGEGDHVFTAWCSNPNNTTDQYIYNDTATETFTIVSTIPKNTISVYPVPSDGHFTVAIQNPGAGEMDLRVVNALGQVVAHHYISLTTQSTLSLDLTNLSTGIYFLYAKIGFDYLTKRVMIWR